MYTRYYVAKFLLVFRISSESKRKRVSIRGKYYKLAIDTCSALKITKRFEVYVSPTPPLYILLYYIILLFLLCRYTLTTFFFSRAVTKVLPHKYNIIIL